jgi:hypothetical protein
MKFSEFKKAEGSTLAVRTINRYADEIGPDSMDYDMFKKSAELLDKQMLKSLAQHIENSDTAPREYVMKKIADHDPETFKKMYGDQEGYLSIMKPMKNLTDAEDNTDRGMNKYGLAARHKDGKFHSFRHGKHTGSFDSAEELAKHQQELIKDESIKEDAPFDGMSLLRMAIMKKFITVQEWDLLKHKWKDAVEELEQNYDDWPEDEGFGSSDHNFAIKELMELVGYEFDDKDTSGSFVVTKQPEEIEKAGIKNARMKGVKDPEQDHREISRIMKYEDAGEKIANMAQSMSKDEFMSHADELGLTPEEAAEHYEKMSGGAHAGKFEGEGEKFTFGQIAKAKAYAKTYANDMTGAVKNIEAIAKGLSNHPEVANSLKRANENQELDRITKLAGLGEGASMMPYYKDPKDEKGMTWTFPDAWSKDEPLDTPYMSNASMRQFLDALGYNPDFEDNQPPVPAKEFIARTTQWLQKNIDKPSAEIPTTVDKNPGGPTMYSGGRDEGHMNRVVKGHNELARKIITKYPEVTHFGFN